MNTLPLGRSDLRVTPICLGTMTFGEQVGEPDAHAILDRAVERGVNFIDTAEMYAVPAREATYGATEAIIGRWLRRGGKRDKVVLASKVGKWSERPGLSAANIHAAADDSLRRLQTDVIDLYQAHEDDESVPLEETLGAFARLVEAGKVRAIGASNYSATRLRDALKVSADYHLPRYESLQPEYNLYDRAGYEAALEPLAREHGLGVIGYYALASGFLSGKYRDAADAGKSGARGARVVARYLNPRGRRILGALDDIAASHRATPAQVALAWQIARPGITAPIVSATGVAQLREVLDAARLSLSAADIAQLDAASAGG